MERDILATDEMDLEHPLPTCLGAMIIIGVVAGVGRVLSGVLHVSELQYSNPRESGARSALAYTLPIVSIGSLVVGYLAIIIGNP